MTDRINIVATGDISFRGAREDTPSEDIFGQTTSIFRAADLSLANLESPLLDDGIPVPGKCTLRGTTGWAKIIKDVGIHFVALANNHMMDYGIQGLQSTIRSCQEVGLCYAGAGNNVREACRPAYIDIKGKRIAILSRTAVIVHSPSYATDQTPGVAFLDVDETVESIATCRKEADIVILSIHWGVENYLYPSKEQRDLAKQFTEAGVHLIIGHHPHVLQGIERLGKALSIYSLGNFVFGEFEWSFINEDGISQTSWVTLPPINRQSGIVGLTFTEDRISAYDFHPTLIGREGTTILVEGGPEKKVMQQLSSRLKWPFYKQFWLIYAMKQEWVLRINPLFKGKFKLEKLKKIRLSHIRRFIKKLIQSGKISLGKTTSPYE